MTQNNYKFAAINRVAVTNIPLPTESDSARGFTTYGTDNLYPQFLLGLTENVTTLSSVIKGVKDYVLGDEIIDNTTGEPIDYDTYTLIDNIVTDYLIFGGFALNPIRNRFGGIATTKYVNFERLRTNKEKSLFWYSEDWTKSYGRVKSTVYPKWSEDNTSDASSIYYYSKSRTGIYPTPIWGSAVESCLIEEKINKFHLNGISNGFASSAIVSFNSGVPSDDQKAEIERNFEEKFTGDDNAGRVLLCFSDDKDHAPEITTLNTTDFSEKYKAATESCRENILLAFRATSNLLGLQKESIGFNTQEYQASFKLFQKTVIAPIQHLFERELKQFGINISIIPFTIVFDA